MMGTEKDKERPLRGMGDKTTTKYKATSWRSRRVKGGGGTRPVGESESLRGDRNANETETKKGKAERDRKKGKRGIYCSAQR